MVALPAGQAMEDTPYAIIVDGAGKVTERVLASHMGSAASPAGSLLTPSVTLVSSTVADGRRTVVVSRPATLVCAHPNCIRIGTMSVMHGF